MKLKDAWTGAGMGSITRAAVIGGGVMGGGLAALLANAGLKVGLLDLEPERAKQSVQRLKRGSASVEAMRRNPMDAAFALPEFARRITTGSSARDTRLITQADIIIEAVSEDLSVKGKVISNAIRHAKEGAFILSNTSAIQLERIRAAIPPEDLDLARRKNLIVGVAHFFNPPARQRLLELVMPEDAPAQRVQYLHDFFERRLGKDVQVCPDVPGFYGNLVGVHNIAETIGFAVRHGMNVADVNAVLGRNVGYAGMGPMDVVDLVGVDTSMAVTRDIGKALPHYRTADPAQQEAFSRAAAMFQEIATVPPVIQSMLDRGLIGRKSETGAGFSRVTERKGADGEPVRTRQDIDLATGEYQNGRKCTLASARAGRRSLRAVLETDDIGGKLAWHVIKKNSIFALLIASAVTTGIEQLDAAMRHGFNRKHGPFQVIDAMGGGGETGTAWFTRKLEEEGIEIPPLLKIAAGRPFYCMKNGVRQVMGLDGDYKPLPLRRGSLDLVDIKSTQEPLGSNDYASIWSIGEGILCVELHGPSNSLGPDTMKILNRAADIIEDSAGQYKGLVIHNPKGQFAVGANIGLVSLMANLLQFEAIDDALYEGQMTLKRLRESDFPVVAAVDGMALGGGDEIVEWANTRVAGLWSNIGLVEVAVGVLPSWGGVARRLAKAIRAAQTSPLLQSPEMEAFKSIGTAQISTSAFHAGKIGILEPDDHIVMNPDDLLAEARRAAAESAPGFVPPKPETFRLGGPGLKAIMDMGVDGFFRDGSATWWDVVVLHLVAEACSGGDTHYTKELTEEDIMAIERQLFIDLLHMPPTLRRIQHMLATGKPRREEQLSSEIAAAVLRDLSEGRRYYTIKKRPAGNPYDRKSVKASPEAIDSTGTDYKKMTPAAFIDHMLGIVRKDEPPVAEGMSAAYNEAARKTKPFMAAQIERLRWFIPLGASNADLLDRATGFLSGRIAAAQAEMAKAKDPAETDVHAGRIAMYEHYQRLIAPIGPLLS